MLLRLDAVRSGYGPIDVLHGLDLDVQAGERLAILGPNGAGKSVLLKTMAGILPVRAGRVGFAGEDVTARGAAARARLGLTLLPQSGLVFPAMTVEENLLMGVYFEPDRSARRAALARTYERFPSIAELRRRRANALSGGQQKMLGLARAMMPQPKALLLDEPSIGLDPRTLGFFADELARLHAQGITLVLVEQNVRFALRVADRVCFLRLGRIERDEPASRLGDPDRLLSLYFGADDDAPSNPLSTRSRG
ncbi:MAG: ABC transporter ATP-binding protein [Lautropia sp.]